MLLIIISPPVEFDGNLSAFKLNSIIVDVSSVPMALELDRVVKIQLTLIEYSEGDAV